MNQEILIIDGHPVYVNKIIGFLRGLTFKNICSASTGEEGLELILSKTPDLIILSAMLAGMDSLEVCKRITKEKKGFVKIIVQIGLFTDEETIQEFKNNGAGAVLLRKEKNLKPLEDTIEKLLFSNVS